jgi:RNA-binding protein
VDVQERMRRRVKRAHHSSPDVIIGKNGITQGLLDEIATRLEKKEVVKVRVLRTGLEVEGGDRREIARRVAVLVGARLMGVRGRTFILYKPKEKKEKKGIAYNLFQAKG